MIIENADILNFKNIREASIDFSEGVNCLLGRNGMGKSNLLEALHFVCMARPMTSLPEGSLIRHGCDLMSVQARFRMDNDMDEKVNIGIVRGKGKSLKRNGKDYDRISSHIGRFPIVVAAPADSELVRGAAQERRRMVDMVISQAHPSYLSQLMRYNRSLENRNNMLRAGVKDVLLYESVESVMDDAAAVVYDHRRRWVEEMKGPVSANYAEIAGGVETLEISYHSVLNERGMQEVLDANRSRDVALGYTSAGIHRDDVVATLDGFPIKAYGSQGQVKSYTVALRLAIFDYLRNAGKETPLLLLDDIFDKPDAERVGRIMQLVSHRDSFGQIFITDTNREHLDETLAGLTGPKKLIVVEDGTFETLR